NRRTLLVSSLAAGACSTLPAAGPADAAFINIATPSESVHSGVASADGQSRVTMRLCRYPEMGLAWVWVHARVGGEFYSYVDHLAPCGHDPAPVSDVAVEYADTARALVFSRQGKAALPSAGTVTGKVRARRTTTSTFGAGDHALEALIGFHPERA